MRVYIELFEVLPEGSTEEADFVRIDVTVWSDTDIDVLINELRAYADENYKSYILQRHKCNHDHDPSMSCFVEVI